MPAATLQEVLKEGKAWTLEIGVGIKAPGLAETSFSEICTRLELKLSWW